MGTRPPPLRLTQSFARTSLVCVVYVVQYFIYFVFIFLYIIFLHNVWIPWLRVCESLGTDVIWLYLMCILLLCFFPCQQHNFSERCCVVTHKWKWRVCACVCVFSGADLGNIYDKGTKHMRYYYALDLMRFEFLLLTVKKWPSRCEWAPDGLSVNSLMKSCCRYSLKYCLILSGI